MVTSDQMNRKLLGFSLDLCYIELMTAVFMWK